jgi:hypothetical protein
MFYKLNFISKYLTWCLVMFFFVVSTISCKVNGQLKMVLANHIIAYL